MNQQHDSITLLEERATPAIVESLYRNGLLNEAGREAGLSMLDPHHDWGYWIGNILLILGWVFILSGIIYFFAFNWENMSVRYKFSTIQVGILVCFAGAWAYSLNTLRGQLFLTGGCILIGVFLAVFGQTYQTGADSYQLFLAWTLIITPFVIISQFAPLWAIWLLLLNMTVILFWQQEISVVREQEYYIYAILLLINGIALLLREQLYYRKVTFLQGRWLRILLSLAIIIISFIPISSLIMSHSFANNALVLSAIFGIIMHLGFLFHYRYHLRDRWVYAMTLISLSLLTCEVGYRLLEKFVANKMLDYLLLTILVILVFSGSAYILRLKQVRT